MRLLSIVADWALAPAAFASGHNDHVRLALRVSVPAKVPWEVGLNWGSWVGWGGVGVCRAIVGPP